MEKLYTRHVLVKTLKQRYDSIFNTITTHHTLEECRCNDQFNKSGCVGQSSEPFSLWVHKLCIITEMQYNCTKLTAAVHGAES